MRNFCRFDLTLQSLRGPYFYSNRLQKTQDRLIYTMDCSSGERHKHTCFGRRRTYDVFCSTMFRLVTLKSNSKGPLTGSHFRKEMELYVYNCKEWLFGTFYSKI